MIHLVVQIFLRSEGQKFLRDEGIAVLIKQMLHRRVLLTWRHSVFPTDYRLSLPAYATYQIGLCVYTVGYIIQQSTSTVNTAFRFLVNNNDCN